MNAAAVVEEVTKKIVQVNQSGPLSKATRKQIGTPGSQKREEMPADVFLMPSERKYPVKIKQDGQWVYSAKLLGAAAARARMNGKADIEAKANALLAKLLPKKEDLGTWLDGIVEACGSRWKKKPKMAQSAMKESIADEIVIDLILEDVMNDGKLFEFNPYHDASGQFTSKNASSAYASGSMAAGRAAGMHAKELGKSREGVRADIKAAMQQHERIYGEDTRRLGPGNSPARGRQVGKGQVEFARQLKSATPQARHDAPDTDRSGDVRLFSRTAATDAQANALVTFSQGSHPLGPPKDTTNLTTYSGRAHSAYTKMLNDAGLGDYAVERAGKASVSPKETSIRDKVTGQRRYLGDYGAMSPASVALSVATHKGMDRTHPAQYKKILMQASGGKMDRAYFESDWHKWTKY